MSSGFTISILPLNGTDHGIGPSTPVQQVVLAYSSACTHRNLLVVIPSRRVLGATLQVGGPDARAENASFPQ
jgi:hypothetical protein